jgi:hypothetical protein
MKQALNIFRKVRPFCAKLAGATQVNLSYIRVGICYAPRFDARA